MANGYVNTVPLGQVGTGAAYVLGPNMALQQWMGRVEQDRNLRQQQAQQAQNIRYRNQQQFSQAMASIPRPTGRMYNRDLQELVSGVTQEGARLMAQGVNPFAPNYNDPNQAQASQRFIQDFNQAQNAVSYIQSLEKERNDTLKRYAASPDEFDYDDYQRILNFENETPIQDVLSGQAQLPVLGKSFNVVRDIVNPLGTMSRQVKRVERGPEGDVTVDETIADIPRITDAVKSAYTAGPGANYLSRRLNEAGLTGARADGILGTTDESEIRQFLDEEFRVPSENNPVVELMAQGRIPAIGSEEYNRFLDDSVKTQLRAERVADKVFNDAIKLSASKVNPKYSEMPNFDYQREMRSQESAERARRAEGRAIEARNEARTRFNERTSNQASTSNFARDVAGQNFKAMEDFRTSIEMNGGRLIPAQVTMADGTLTQEEPNTFVITLPQTEKVPQTRSVGGITRTETIDKPFERRIKLDGSPASQRQVSHILNILKGVSTKDKDNKYVPSEFNLTPGALDDL